MTHTEASMSPENPHLFVTGEEAFAGIGLPFDTLKNLSPEGIRVPNPFINNLWGIFFLNIATGAERLVLPDEWQDSYYGQDSTADFWPLYYADVEGKTHIETRMKEELERALLFEKFLVTISFEEETVNEVKQSSMVVAPRTIEK